MNAIRKLMPHSTGDVIEDGSLVVSVEQLKQFGDGDVAQGRRELRMILAAQRDYVAPPAPVDRPSTVRVATVNDERALLALLIQDLNENAVKIAPIDEESVLANIQCCTRQRGGIAGVIDGPDGNPVAVTVLIAQKWWWSKGYHIQEIVNYVHPDHRKSHHLDHMIAFEKWATQQWSKNAGYQIYLLCGVLAVHRVREKILLYKRKFSQAGIFAVFPSPFDKGSRP